MGGNGYFGKKETVLSYILHGRDFSCKILSNFSMPAEPFSSERERAMGIRTVEEYKAILRDGR
ncbi:MAG TPA: hypothetical protein VLS90_09075, partial [Thermodesulfobacteriota bacterium]|nr:hypothetical protein [Thermodesulfobacteriota bacterium]